MESAPSSEAPQNPESEAPPSLDPEPKEAPESPESEPAAPAMANATAAVRKRVPLPSDHPPYARMIITAIGILNERKGSSKAAIAKYIASAFKGLPHTHSALLSHHLKRLKKKGFVLMVKHSYKLNPKAKSSLPPAVTDPSSKRGRGRPKKIVGSVPLTSKRGRGRPPSVLSPKPVSSYGPVQGKGSRGRPRKLFKPTPLSSSGPVASGVKKGRGRPPSKTKPVSSFGPDSVKKSSGRPPKPKVVKPKPVSALSSGSRGRGRPPKPAGSESAAVPAKKSRGRATKTDVTKAAAPLTASKPKGRAKKHASSVSAPPTPLRALPAPEGGDGLVVSQGRPRGRPAKVAGKSPGRPKKVGSVPSVPKVSSGKPAGRPRKNPVVATTTE